ncbi:MAG: hypothetical protein LC541_19405 [Candidatus Thiodiazotropha sp.]|nr:hypothetical protein [Candidatus Thiodiazotropha sp.]MCU7805302.1 hypothetical protein [Candidatus Thiodiazotropha sp. (ex Lucinoma borealis)]MCU7841673.1 hypothetical protein [Candidatus Thiodiazotropha sp. (ex Troendleina suluensis)]MCU7885874.1 hypothetical protein [Candidatus Thiodiazotropha sp. (ex Lucinoma annulata)]MCM8885437.1 hypothetical protein [Candidatus Thiodiazotropha sp.]
MELCAILLSWVFTLSDYQQVDNACPEMRMVEHSWLEERACDGRACKVLGWYPGSGDVVYLDDRMDLDNNIFHTSVAVHELVHWLQDKEGALLENCEQSIEAEREAYNIQSKFLVEYGTYYPVGAVLPMLRCEDQPAEDS